MYRKNVISNKAHNVAFKIILRWSETIVISKTVNENDMLVVTPGYRAIVLKAQVSQLKFI